MYNALLLDTQSIQKYIFSGNKLKTNIGASYIVDRVFQGILGDVLGEMFPQDDFSSQKFDVWDIAQDEADPFDFCECSVAYIGGGNALLLFRAEGEDRRREAVEKFTRRLLSERPGLRIGVAYGTMSVGTMKADMGKLHRELKKNQASIFPQVTAPYTGLTLTCDVSGDGANAFVGGRFVSQEAAVKEQLAAEANQRIKDKFSAILRKKYDLSLQDYAFPMQMDKLGQKDGDRYIAIVHVDGNNMGKKISECETLVELRKLSREIARKNESSFAELIRRIILADRQGLFEKLLEQEEERGQRLLPIRPLIIGGDDVTFACPAAVAVLFTKTLLEILAQTTAKDAPEKLSSPIARSMDACGGIIILPDQYPFFRGYELAGEVCDAAKKAMRDSGQVGSWLDFIVMHGDEGTLEDILHSEYSSARSSAIGALHFGPYRVNNGAATLSARRRNIEPLLECVNEFKTDNPPAWLPPGNKLKALRNVLQHGEDEAARFLTRLENQGKHFPRIDDWQDFVGDNLWTDDQYPKTPFVDVILLSEYWPDKEVTEAWQKLK